MSETTFDPFEYEQPFWEPIGQFVINFGYLESSVNWAIGGLLQIHYRQTEAVTSQIINLRSRIRLIEKLCWLLTADVQHRETISEIIKEIADLNSYRNRLLHGPWGAYSIPPSGEGYWQKLYVGSQDFKYKMFEAKLSDITENTNRIVHAKVDLTNLVQDVIREREALIESDPSPDTP